MFQRVVLSAALLTYNLSVTYIDAKGRRVTTENSYLTPDVLARPNLTVAVGASVTKILFDAAQGGQEPRAFGVEFCSSPEGPRFRVRARKEVVLSYVPPFGHVVLMLTSNISAGAIHTPQVRGPPRRTCAELTRIDHDALRPRSCCRTGEA